MQLKDFREMVNRVLFCAKSGLSYGNAKEEAFLEKKRGELVIAASNEKLYYRLGFATMTVENDFPDFDLIIVRAKDLRKIVRARGTAQSMSIRVSGGEASFYVGSTRITANTLPLPTMDSGILKIVLELCKRNGITKPHNPLMPHEKFMRLYGARESLPERFPSFFAVNCPLLLETLDIVSAIADGWSYLTLNLSHGTLVLRVISDGDSAEAEIPCNYSGEAATLEFMLGFFTEIIKRVGDDFVSVRFMDGYAAITPAHSAERAMPKYGYCFFLEQKNKK